MSVVSPEIKSRRRIIILLTVGILVLVGVGASAYYLGRNQGAKTTISNNQSSIPAVASNNQPTTSDNPQPSPPSLDTTVKPPVTSQPSSSSPVTAANTATKPVQVHFTTASLQNNDCGATRPLQRQIPATEVAVAQKSLSLLFEGPTAEEAKQGYQSAFQGWSEALDTLKINGDTLYLNFNNKVLDQKGKFWIGNFGASCSSGAWNQIKNTVTQFPSIKNVVYAIEGNPSKWTEFVWGDTCQGRLAAEPKNLNIQKQCQTNLP